MTLINLEDVLALIPKHVSPAMASELADAIAALPAQVVEPVTTLQDRAKAALDEMDTVGGGGASAYNVLRWGKMIRPALFAAAPTAKEG